MYEETCMKMYEETVKYESKILNKNIILETKSNGIIAT